MAVEYGNLGYSINEADLNFRDPLESGWPKMVSYQRPNLDFSEVADAIIGERVQKADDMQTVERLLQDLGLR